MAIVSRAVFEKMVPKSVDVGALLETDRYSSKNKIFETLAAGGSLFLVTVRPPDERLWLVAVVDAPKMVRDAWVGKPNTTPIADVTSAVSKLVLASGQGITAKKGALGMSLQTPRVLAPKDEELLLGMAGGKTAKTKSAAPVEAKSAKATTARPATPTKVVKRVPVVWAKLRHARGSGKNVPDLLAGIKNVGWRGRDFEDLREAFVSKGDAFTASGALFGALVDLAVDARTERPEELLSFALEILGLGAPAELLVHGLDRKRSKLKGRYAKPLAAALLTEAHESVPALQTALEDTRPAVRGMAALLLGLLVDAAASSAPLLVARMASEKEPGERACVIFGAMHLARAASEAAPVTRPSLEKLRDDARSDPMARGAALIALATIEGKWPDVAKARDTLVAFFAASIPLGLAPHASAERDPGTLALRLLEDGPASADARLEGSLAALEAMHVAPPLPEEAFIRSAWTVPVLERWFPPRKGGDSAHIKDPLDVAKLGKDARRILVALSQVRPFGGNYGHAGLPPDLRSRRRLLGLEPPSLMDDIVKKSKATDRPMPRWQVVTEAMRQYDRLRDGKNATRPVLHEWVKANTFDLAPKQWLEVWAEVHAEVHGIYTYMNPDPLLTAFAAVSAADLREWATRYLDEIVGHSTPERPRPLGPDRAMRCDLGVDAVLGLIRAKAPIPARHDHAVTLFGTPAEIREIFEAIPRERRLGVVASIHEMVQNGYSNKGNFDKRKVAGVLDLVPEAASFVLAYEDLEDFERETEEDGVPGLFDIVTALAKKEPAVKAALAEAMRRWTAPKPKAPKKRAPKTAKKKVGVYRFMGGKHHDLAAAEKLTGVARAQFLWAAERYGGGPYKKPREFFVWMGKEIDEAPEETSGGTHWTIERTSEKGKPAYEMWTFMVDNGTVFEAGSADDIGVHMTQGGFESMLGTPESNELADDLQEVVPF